MLRLLVSMLLFMSLFQVKVKSMASEEIGVGLVILKDNHIKKRLDSGVAVSGVRFLYAELLYQRLYGEDKLIVNGNSVNEALKKSVAQSKYRDVALDLLGAEGWELSATVHRELSSGYEILFYLKKKIE